MALLGIRLEDEIHREFKLWCVRLGVNMSDVVRELIVDWIAKLEEEAGQVAGPRRADHV